MTANSEPLTITSGTSGSFFDGVNMGGGDSPSRMIPILRDLGAKGVKVR